MIYTALTLLVLLQYADWWSTTVILRNGGREFNPVLRKLFDKFGVQKPLIAYKLFVCAAGGVLYYTGHHEYIYALCGLYAAVVGLNLRNVVRSTIGSKQISDKL